MHTIDNAYDNALRNVVDNEIYNADSANLHLIGMGMDNQASDKAEDAIKAAEYRQQAEALGL